MICGSVSRTVHITKGNCAKEGGGNGGRAEEDEGERKEEEREEEEERKKRTAPRPISACGCWLGIPRPSLQLSSPAVGMKHSQSGTGFQGEQHCFIGYLGSAHTINGVFISPFSCQCRTSQSDSVYH